MFGKKNKASNTASKAVVKSQPSVISTEMSVLGNIVSDGTVDINGIIDGNVKARSITVRAGGKVRGDVMADMVKVFGHVTGMIKARSVVLHESAHVDGVIMHESLTVEDGAQVDGKFKHMEKIFLDDGDLEEQMQDAIDEEDEDKIEILENLRIVQ